MRRLKELREEMKLSQKEFGARIGYSQRAISNWENNITEPNIENLKQIASFFNVSIDYLVGITSDWETETNETNTPSIPEDARNILTLYETLSPERKREAVVLLKTLNELDSSVPNRSGTAKHA